ncbi:hypothetical protein [Thermococcus peptonophilus]|uniref:Uncharacterized protein n=1 Tax=Thermococcus peptonophilus TaxID=53952 RepID=A0A142CVI8_9EURY|nr:hypothetical protein [Thermococcus peptonophilus]AMQ18790.1 hypothetical protein A0127_06190 [Thermococcus peptonophilus]
MNEDEKVFLRYLMFTVPHATVLAGALLGVLLVLKVRPEMAAGIFSLVYGTVLAILAAVVRDHFSKSSLYKIFLSIALFLVGGGVLILLNMR